MSTATLADLVIEPRDLHRPSCEVWVGNGPCDCDAVAEPCS